MLWFILQQKTAYVLRSSDWSSDVCSSALDRAAQWPGGTLTSDDVARTRRPGLGSCVRAGDTGPAADGRTLRRPVHRIGDAPGPTRLHVAAGGGGISGRPLRGALARPPAAGRLVRRRARPRPGAPESAGDRKTVVSGKRVYGLVIFGGVLHVTKK